MTLFNLMAILMVLAAAFSYINQRFLKVPSTIGIMLISMLMSLAMLIMEELGLGLVEKEAVRIVASIDFNETLMVGMLGFLLFAGALQLDINDLMEKKWEVGIFSTVGIIISTLMVGTAMHFILLLLGSDISYVYCLLFGALISPTDPVAVVGILKKVGAPKSLETKIAGESLFNDGVGVVIFIALLGIAKGGSDITAGKVTLLFLEEALGGFGFGLVIGYAGYKALKSIDDYNVEILITLAMVMGGYALASAMHVSGPIAIVVAGLLIGNHGRQFAMSENTRLHLDKFWSFADEILNSILFVLMGLEIMIIKISSSSALAGIAAILVALLARLVSISIPVYALRKCKKQFSNGVVRIMTWGGLRGGICVALALSLPRGDERELIITMTYFVVAFSIIIQGLTIKQLVKKLK